jgi:hypothetical protein
VKADDLRCVPEQGPANTLYEEGPRPAAKSRGFGRELADQRMRVF